jgi:hypothetical protein
MRASGRSLDAAIDCSRLSAFLSAKPSSVSSDDFVEGVEICRVFDQSAFHQL